MSKAKNLFSRFKKVKKPICKTHIPPIDILTNGGIALGGMYSIGSPEGSGKSTIILQICKSLIENYKCKVVYCDVEQGMSDELLRDMDMLKYDENTFWLVQNVSTFTELAEFTNEILSLEGEEKYHVFIIDSLSAVATKQLQFEDPEKKKVAPKAKAMTEYITGFRGRLGVAQIATFVVGQARVAIGATQFEPSTIIALPIAVQHAVDLTFVVEHKEFKSYQIFKDIKTPNGIVSTSIGYNGKIYTKKNRKGLPTIKLNLPMIFGKGCDKVLFVRSALESCGFIYTHGTKAILKLDIDYKIEVTSKDSRDADINNYIAENYDMIEKFLVDNGYFNISNPTKLINYAEIVENLEDDEDEESIENLEKFDELSDDIHCLPKGDFI